MTTIGKNGGNVTRTPGLDQANWASTVKNTARSLELGMKTLQALILPDGKVPGGLYAAASMAMNESVDLLKTLLETRFDTTMSKSTLGMLGVAQRALKRADSTFYAMDKKVDDARLPPGAVAGKVPGFGNVDQAAGLLVSQANASGKPHYYDFNGTNLIAMPGGTATDVVNDWRQAMGAMQDPLGSLSYDVQSRAADEAAKSELSKLAKEPPRALGAILANLEAKVGAGTYGDTFMAGLCELKHPKEIRSFIEHVLENPPKKDAAQSTDAARDIAKSNITFWVRDRGGAQTGTESSWLSTLADVEKARASGGARPAAVKPIGLRDVGQILGDLQKLVDKKVYSHDFMAGLCELKHPDEIKKFLEHFFDNPPKKDASQSTSDARAIMQNNVTFWARDREGTAPGTKQTWLAALNTVVKAREPLQFEPMLGSRITAAVDDMIKLANSPEAKGREVHGTFNGTKLVAKAGDTADKVMAPFEEATAAANKRYEAAQQAAAAARASRLEGAVSSGLKIVDTPPPGMTFDTRGLLEPGGMYNSKGTRQLQLITEAQLKQLPDGTQLTSISGDKAIKGIDNIDNDTRGGFIAFGFQL